MVMPSSSTDFFSPPLFSPFSFCLCSPLLFFFLLSRSPHCLLLLFLSFLPSSSLSPPSALASWWCCCSRWFTVATSPLQTKMTVWKGCSTNTTSSPPVVSSGFFSLLSRSSSFSPSVSCLFRSLSPLLFSPLFSPHCNLSSSLFFSRSPSLGFLSSLTLSCSTHCLFFLLL